METHAELKGRCTRVTSMARKPNAEPQACRTEVEPGAWQTEAAPEGTRSKADPEGGNSLVESKVWKAEVQPEALKSTMKPCWTLGSTERRFIGLEARGEADESASPCRADWEA